MSDAKNDKDTKMHVIMHGVVAVLNDVRAEYGTDFFKDRNVDLDKLIIDASVMQAKLQQQDR